MVIPPFLSKDLADFQQEFKQQLANSPKIDKILAYLLQQPGKSVRPRVFLTLCSLLNCQTPNRFLVAVAAEYIHTASLIHDDIIDEAQMRRNQRALYKQWDVKTAVLIGDFLYSRAFELLAKSGYSEVSGLFATAANRLSISEVNQLGGKQDLGLLTAEEPYFEIIQEKTAVLFGAVCQAALSVSMAAETELQTKQNYKAAVVEFGMNFGMAFQLRDDGLDYQLGLAARGKEGLQDLREGKITLPLIILYSLSDQQQQAFIRELIKRPTAQATKQVLQLLLEHRVPELLNQRIQEFRARALASLTALPARPQKDYLKALVEKLTVPNL